MQNYDLANILEVDMKSSSCPHLSEAFDDKHSRDTIFEKYKSVVTWNVHSSQRVQNSAKRRKVGDMLKTEQLS